MTIPFPIISDPLHLYGDDPIQDLERMDEISALDIVTVDHVEGCVPLARQAAEELEMPMAFVSIVMRRVQRYVAMHGAPQWIRAAGGTPIEWSLCRLVACRGRAFVVGDTLRHPLTRQSPLATAGVARCYAGTPLKTSRGITIGALCVVGSDAHQFRPSEIDRLHDLAAQAVIEIEAVGRRN